MIWKIITTICFISAVLALFDRINTKNSFHLLILKIKQKYKKSQNENVEKLHLLIEKGVSFTDEIRTRILNMDLDVEIVDHFKDGQKISYYESGWRNFVEDISSKWLITIYPEEPDARISENIEKELLKKMEKKGKSMICIESGHDLQKSSKSVYVISTDHERATRELISALAKQILEKEREVHFILLPGPKDNSSANQRRTVQVNYLAWLIYHHNKLSLTGKSKKIFDQNYHSKWSSILSYTHDNTKLRISILPDSSWYKHDAIKIVSNSIEELDIDRDFVHTCFLCCNDDLAIGALEAVKNWTRDKNIDFRSLNISFFGFDGTDEMTEIISNETKGGTMKVRFDEICEEVKNTYLGNKRIKGKPLTVNADLKIN